MRRGIHVQGRKLRCLTGGWGGGWIHRIREIGRVRANGMRFPRVQRVSKRRNELPGGGEGDCPSGKWGGVISNHRTVWHEPIGTNSLWVRHHRQSTRIPMNATLSRARNGHEKHGQGPKNVPGRGNTFYLWRGKPHQGCFRAA